MKITFTIGESGAVKQALVSRTTLNHQATEQCLTTTVKRWRFPRPEGQMPDVTYPFVFQPGGP